jgi:twinkle protein
MELIQGEVKELAKRGINAETCAKFGYIIGSYSGQPVQVAEYRDDEGAVVAQHLRFANKDFIWLGDSKRVSLWGRHLWRDKGKMVVVTEGEIDAMSISMLQDNKWPVVSIPSGAQGAKKAVGKAVEWLEQFESVIFAFDMDEPGKRAAAECAALLTPGKAKIWNISEKDANALLLTGKRKEIIDALWGAKVYRPDGIIAAEDTWDLVNADDATDGTLYPWDGLNQKLHGLRVGELVTITAGTGIGKSQLCREIAAHLITVGQKVGYIALEESVKHSVRSLLSIYVNKRLHLQGERAQVKESDLRAAFERLKGRVFFYDHWGSTDSDNLTNRIRFLARGCECRWIVLDHISIVISGEESGDERRMIDNTMTKLRKLVEELKIGLILVSHLKRPEGKGHEEGAPTSLSQLRGSAAIGQLSDIVIGAERNQQSENEANLTRLRVLKNRYTGETGLIETALFYDKATGRLSETAACPFDVEE